MNGRSVFSDINKGGFDCALFFDEVSQRYLCDFHTTDGIVIVSKKETALFTDARYFEAAENALKSKLLSSDVSVYLLKKGIFETVADYLAETDAKSVCIDPKLTTITQFEKLKDACKEVKFGFSTDICLKYRRVKTNEEIEKIKMAQKITDGAFSHIIGFITEKATEVEVASELEYFMRKNGSDGFAFETISVSGKNSSLPHGVPTTASLTKNSFLTMDFGAKFDGYCSDMTRTVVLGKADKEMKRIYETVLTAQKEAMKFIRAGVPCREADRVARDIISDAGYGEYFSHSLGHSLGLEIHELPSLSPKSDDTLVAGNIVTVEPGIYIPGVGGIRIEDTCLITEDGCEILTSFDHSFTVV